MFKSGFDGGNEIKIVFNFIKKLKRAEEAKLLVNKYGMPCIFSVLSKTKVFFYTTICLLFLSLTVNISSV